jgi:solute carrier family 25 citrate transporter 1
MNTNHPATAGWITGSLEIVVTYPLEYVKTQLQLQQQASALYAGADRYRGAADCFTRTLRERGPLGLYRGGSAWIIFAGPRSATRFAVFDACMGTARRRGLQPSAALDMACGLAAGLVQAVVTDTANQCIQIKMVHDQSPRGPQRYRGFVHAVRCIHAEEGIVRGFYAGIVPAIAKGATTNCLRFLGFGVITREMRRLQPAERAGQPLAAHQTMLAGGVAGAISAVLTQPIDTVKANMMGLEARAFSSTWGCARQLVAAGGARALFQGVGPRAVKVFLEVGLQFTLFERVGGALDRLLDAG